MQAFRQCRDFKVDLGTEADPILSLSHSASPSLRKWQQIKPTGAEQGALYQACTWHGPGTGAQQAHISCQASYSPGIISCSGATHREQENRCSHDLKDNWGKRCGQDQNHERVYPGEAFGTRKGTLALWLPQSNPDFWSS